VPETRVCVRRIDMGAQLGGGRDAGRNKGPGMGVSSVWKTFRKSLQKGAAGGKKSAGHPVRIHRRS